MINPGVLRKKAGHRPLPVFLLLMCSFLMAPNALAQMTDIVYLKNGDRISGSVSEMNLGEMRFETQSMGFVNIKWQDVERIKTSKTIQFETSQGVRHLGTVSVMDAGKVAVQTRSGEKLLAADDIVYFQRIKADRSLWEAMDKDLRVGFSFTKASDVMRWNIGAGLVYKAENYSTRFRFDSFVTNNGQGTDSRRANATAGYQRHLRNRFFWFGSTSAQTNDELGIDSRFLLTAGAGRFVWQRPSSELLLALGLAGNRENSTGGPQLSGTPETTLEGLFQLEWTFYKLHTPSSRINTSLEYFPGITDSGRNRANLNINLRQEFVKDFYWNVEFFSSYDSRPPAGAISGEDYGINTSLEYLW